SAAARLTTSISCACARRNPSKTAPLRLMRRRPFMMVFNPLSEREPQQQIGRTVGRGVAAEAIIVAAAAIEFSVGGLLQRKFGVEPRQIVPLDDPALGIGATVGAGDHAGRRSARIQPGIDTASGRKVAEGRAKPAPEG